MKDFQFILEYNSVQKELTKSPIGWDTFNISYKRNLSYHSVLRNVTNTLKFVDYGVTDEGGYQFIKDAYEQDGIKAIVTITINQRDTNTNGYVFFYTGILLYNPKKWGIETSPNTFEIGIIDSSKLQEFKSNEDIEIDFNSTTSLNGTSITPFVNMPKEVVFKTIDLYLASVSDGGFSGTGNEPTETTLTFYMDYNGNLTLNEMGDRLTINFPAEDENIYSNTLDYESYFYCTTFAGNSSDSITIDNAPVSQAWTYKKTIIFIFYDSSDVEQSRLEQIIHTENGTGNETGLSVTQAYSFSFTEREIESGGYVTMQTEVELVTGGTGIDKTVGSSTSVTNAEFIERTDGAADYGVDSYFPAEAFDRSIQIITNETDTTKLVYSDDFGRTDSEFTTYPVNGKYALFCYNTGWNIRQYPDKPFLTTFKKLFKSYDALFCLTLIYNRVDDKFELKDRLEAYRLDEILELENVSDFKVEPSDIDYFNKILSGYPKQTFEEFQGVNEFNLEAEHYIDMPVKNNYNARSVASTSSVAIELMRRKRYRTNASEDTNDDEKNFIVEIEKNGLIYETIQGANSLTGFNGSDEYYNYNISPRNNLLRHTGFINSPLFKHSLQTIDKSKYQKETDVTFENINGDVVSELSNISQTELGDLRILPEVYKFKSIWNRDIINQLNNDPHGYITVPFEGVDYKGYILSVVGNPSDKKAEYTLIRANI